MNNEIFSLIYVDDIRYFKWENEMINGVKNKLRANIKMKDKGSLPHFLGPEIDYDRE